MNIYLLVVCVGLERDAPALEACLAHNLVLPSFSNSTQANVAVRYAVSVDIKSCSAVGGGSLFVGLHG